MDGAIDGLRLADGVRGHGRRRLELLLWNGLGRIKRRRLLVRHAVCSLIHGAILIVLLRHTVGRSVDIGCIGVLWHIGIVHVLSGIVRVLLLVVMLWVVLCLMTLMCLVTAPMLSAWLDRRGRRHGSWPSVGTRCAGHVEVGLTGIARTTLHGWLPSRQAVGHLAGLGGDGSQCRSLLRKTHDDDKPSPEMLRRY